MLSESCCFFVKKINFIYFGTQILFEHKKNLQWLNQTMKIYLNFRYFQIRYIVTKSYMSREHLKSLLGSTRDSIDRMDDC